MVYFQYVLLGFLIICAISVSFSRNLLRSILIYMSFSLIMSILWICLESPDLAITEAAVGAGVTSVLFFVTLKKIHAMSDVDADIKAEILGEETEDIIGTAPELMEAIDAVPVGGADETPHFAGVSVPVEGEHSGREAGAVNASEGSSREKESEGGADHE